VKKKSQSKPVEVQKEITDLEEFQAAYGGDWLKITQMPAFRAGLQLLNVRKLDEITSLSNEDIDKHALLILSDLIGQLKHENNMFNLHKEQSFRLPMDEEVRYVSPEEEAAHQQLAEKFAQQTTKNRYGN
jgi:hypothetical protein